MRKSLSLCLTVLLTTLVSFSQSLAQHHEEVYVDAEGVLRWKGTEEEVSLFGVNYTTPFAYSYRAHKRLGLPLKSAIDLDVAHMVRLDLDAFRVHVWDREISDSSGNLLRNEHLDLFDYLLARLADSGIKTILTPIAWWGNGWPEPDESTHGFSHNFSKLELLTNQNARQAQRRYLKQFIEHRNPYRQTTYIDDPSIIALEIINEPNHPTDDRATTEYVNEMVGVLRDAGYRKPIFYNISENWSNRQANAVTRANVEGVSFQWYPTGLVHGQMLSGNFLPNVHRYMVRSEGVVGFGKKAKMVYEFDAADVAGSYMYPAIVRSFREIGMQFAAMFSYDPVQIAWSNTEYPTHYVNLLYTPSKAISLMIAANAFRRLPRMKSYGNYPEDNRFQDFRVSYEEDLSEMNSASVFLYSNSTQSLPKDSRSLRRVVGVGSSPVVQYDGTGAYFLEKLSDGIWRLEVYPDVLWLRDPFEATSMSRQVARLFWRERSIRIALLDLGEAYAVSALSGARRASLGPLRVEHLVRPGVYLVTATTAEDSQIKKYLSKTEPFLEDLYSPPAEAPGVYVANHSCQYALESTGPSFSFLIGGEDSIDGAALFVRRLGWRGFAKHALKKTSGFTYALVDTLRALQSGQIEYCVAVDVGGTTLTFPEGIKTTPGKWDFSPGRLWTMKVLTPGEPLVVLDVMRDRKDLVFPHFSPSLRYALDYRNGPTSEEASASLNVKFSQAPDIPFGFQLGVAEFLRPLAEALNRYHTVAVKARSSQEASGTIGITLMMSNGKSFTAKVEISSEWHERRIPISSFQGGGALMLPNAYPRFLPKVWHPYQGETHEIPDLRMLDRIQVTVDPSDAKQLGEAREMSFEVSSIILIP